jgi:TonB family protein
MIAAFVIATFLQAIPLADPATWRAGVDYPPAAMRNGDTGVVVYEVAIGPAGDVTDCRIAESSGSAILDEATCRAVLRNARFQPPKPGDASSATYRGKIGWSLDGGDNAGKSVVVIVPELPLALIGVKTVVDFEVGEDGRVRDCKIVSSSGSNNLDATACRSLTERGRFTPSTGPVPRQSMSIEWQPSS